MALVPMEFDLTSLDEITFSDFIDTSYKDSVISSITGNVYRMIDSDLYIVYMAITIASGTSQAGSSGYSIGRFKKNIFPRVVLPLVNDAAGEPKGSLYSSSSATNSRIYGNTGTGLNFVSFTCHAS